MKTLGVYIHIPFCVRKCDYCDFLSAPSDEKTMESYVKALIKEIELSKDKMAEYLIDTVFIGGGTPSILEGELICNIVCALKNNCRMADDFEMTIECNPGTVKEEKLLAYKSVGINRLSFGLQSADNNELKSIGRIHTYEEFLESYELAVKCGFDNINIDLMSALPGQSEENYKSTLEKIIALNPQHISAYSLIVEEGTKMHERVEKAELEGATILPGEDEERKMYYLTKELLGEAGYSRYEISNYSKAGFECKHNIGYWQRKEYLGFGIGAASLYKEERYSNTSDINLYIEERYSNTSDINLYIEERYSNTSDINLYIEEMSKAKNSLGVIQENRQELSKQEQMEEFMFLGLRMMDGISVDKFKETFGESYEDVYGPVSSRLMEQRLLEQDGKYIRLTEHGIDVSNYVMAEFLF